MKLENKDQTQSVNDADLTNNEIFSSDTVVNQFWQQINMPILSYKERISVRVSFVEEQGKTLTSDQIGDLQDALIGKARVETKNLLRFFTLIQENGERTVSDSEKERAFRECVSLRHLMGAASSLQHTKLIKMTQIDEKEKDVNEYAARLFSSAFHNATECVKSAANLWVQLEDPQILFSPQILHTWQKKLNLELQGLVDYLGEEGGFLDLVDRSTEIVRGSSGRDACRVVSGIQRHFEEIGVEFTINYRKIEYNNIKNEGSSLYSVLKNMIANALEEQSKYSNERKVKVDVDITSDGKCLRVACINDGHFPDEWLDGEGNIIVTGKTTKQTGLGIGLKIMTDYVASVGGTLNVINSENQITMILIAPFEDTSP